MSENENPEVPSAGQNEHTETEVSGSAPEWLQKELERARKDAAKYRDRARNASEETETKLRDEFTARETELNSKVEELTSKYEEAAAQVSERETAITKLRLALDNGIPAEHVESFTKRLVGETYEELKTDAESLASFFSRGTVQEDHSQGSGAEPLNSPTLLRLIEQKFGKF